MRLKQAILEFLANELHSETSAITDETTFDELGVDPSQQADLMHRLQDSLAIILPEEKVANMTTIGDLLDAVEDLDEVE
ncbi:MAG: acyl carrier protein [bacterium]|nr:acyl carrier protein [bacterium]